MPPLDVHLHCETVKSRNASLSHSSQMQKEYAKGEWRQSCTAEKGFKPPSSLSRPTPVCPPPPRKHPPPAAPARCPRCALPPSAARSCPAHPAPLGGHPPRQGPGWPPPVCVWGGGGVGVKRGQVGGWVEAQRGQHTTGVYGVDVQLGGHAALNQQRQWSTLSEASPARCAALRCARRPLCAYLPAAGRLHQGGGP